MRTLFLTVAAALVSGAILGQDKSHNNLNAPNNQGKVTQNNTTIILRDAARKNGINEYKWPSIVTPDHLPTPHNLCTSAQAQTPEGHPGSQSGSTQRLDLILGGAGAYCTQQKCKVVTIMRSDGSETELLTLNRRGDAIALDATIYDSNGFLVAKIDSNSPHVNRNESLSPKRTSPHELLIKDNRGQTALYLHFLNKQAMYIEGNFFAPFPVGVNQQAPVGVLVTPDGFEPLPERTPLGLCLGNSVDGALVIDLR